MTNDRLSEDDRADSGSTANLCPFGCYWACEHRPAQGEEGAGTLHPVHDEAGRALNRCRECGDFFYSVMDHSREHARKRQLGWLPEHLPDAWPSSPSPSSALMGRPDLGGS